MDTIFIEHLKENPSKMEMLKQGLEEGRIKEFDLELLSKLKKTNYGGIPGNIYLYAYPTTFETVGNKIEILCWVYRNEDYKIVHGETSSTREIFFQKYNSKHLDFNSWLEIKIGTKEYVIDTFSMLIFEKDLYYKIENPNVTKIVTSDIVKSAFRYEDTNFSEEYTSYDALPMLMEHLEYLSSNSPYKEYLEKELGKLKQKVNYDQMLLDYNKSFDYKIKK